MSSLPFLRPLNFPAKIQGTSNRNEDTGSLGDDPEHLLVLVHGIDAGTTDWAYAEAVLQKELGSNYIVYVSSSNTYKRTHDGIDKAGERLANEVMQVVSERRSLKKISFLAHSLGGLIARYAIASLYTGPMIAGLDPIHFITLATPHLGLRGKKQIPSKRRSNLHPERLSKLVFIKYNKALHERFQTRRFLNKREDCDSIVVDDLNYSSEWMTGRPGAWNEFVYEEDGLTWVEFPILFGFPILEKIASWVAPFFVGRTGYQIFLTDGKSSEPPLLLRMTSDLEDLKFISSLASFRHRSVYANVSYDHMVGWHTSSIRRKIEGSKHSLQSLEGYQHIMKVEHFPPLTTLRHLHEAMSVEKVNLKNLKEDHDTIEEEMISRLERVGWKKVDVSFHSTFWPFMAHTNINVRREWINSAGRSIIAHVADCLREEE